MSDLPLLFDAYEADDEQWVAILTGAGDKAFCADMDLRYQAAGGNLFTAPKGFGGMTARPHMKKPIIAAVNGVAFGGGFEIALACDIIVAAAHARFALPEPRVGLAVLAGGIQRLPRDIGLKNAMGTPAPWRASSTASRRSSPAAMSDWVFAPRCRANSPSSCKPG